jgi:Xaa-Pro aminopeptidase
VVLPGFLAMQKHIKPGGTLEDIRTSGEFFRAHGVQSRPVLAHGIDFVTNSPHISTEGVRAFPYERTIQPGTVLMLEPCPITADGLLGMFFGHTYIITEDGTRRVTDCPDELLVARW